MIQTVDAHELFMREENLPVMQLSPAVYEMRTEILLKRMIELGYTHVIIYGDREHFSNMEYFTKYDCRFEESLFIMDRLGEKSVLVGNEGMGFSKIIPYPVKRYLFQNFSLQGQPREESESLPEILKKAGITRSSRIGIIGYKYMEGENGKKSFDIPHYLVQEILAVCPEAENITEEITGLPNGIRMRLYTAEEIAWAESVGNRTADVIQRMYKNLKPGMKEYELAQKAQVGFDPQSMHPITNFGEQSVTIGMGSPGESVLKTGEVCGMCYGLRGSLISRTAVAAYDRESCREELRDKIDSFYKKYYEAVAAWYETAHIGVTGGELYQAVMSVIGSSEFGVSLNPGHHTGCDEWTNSAIYKNSEVTLADGAFMQVDIIASASDPVRTAVCEDAVVIAGKELRNSLRKEYPETYRRIIERQTVLREVLGIHISDEVLPMSNLTGVYIPYMLNTSKVFAKR